MEVTEAKELALRLIIRDEVANMMDDDTLGPVIEVMIANALAECGLPQMAQRLLKEAN